MSIEREIIERGCWRYSQVRIIEVESTFVPSEIQRNIVENKWADRPSDIEDWPRWRLESIRADEQLTIEVSRSSGKWHFILKEEKYDGKIKYPNPLSVTTLLISKDKKLMLGVREGSDQGNRLHAVGGGFIDPIILSGTENPEKWTIVPEHPFHTSQRELSEETTAKIEIDDVIERFRILGAVWGDNHDTSLVMYAPVEINSTEIKLLGSEHSSFHFASIDTSNLDLIIVDEKLEGVNAKPTDHMLLSLELLRDFLMSTN